MEISERNLTTETWVERYGDISRVNAARMDTFKLVGDALRQAGVTFVPLKGMDLLLRLPRGLGHRPMYDTDLLIRRRELPAAATALRRLGWRGTAATTGGFRSYVDQELEFRSPQNEASVDLVWGAYFLDSTDSLVERRQLKKTKYGDIELLHPHDALFYMLGYAFYHRRQFTPQLIADVRDFLVQEVATLDWTAWSREMNGLPARSGLCWTLRYVQSHGEIHIPEDTLRSLASRTWRESWRSHLQKRCVTEQPPPQVQYLPYVLAAPGWKGKINLLRRAFWPGNDLVSLLADQPVRTLSPAARLLRPWRILLRGIFYVSRDIALFVTG